MFLINIVFKLIQNISYDAAVRLALYIFPKNARPFVYYQLQLESANFTSRGSRINNPANLAFYGSQYQLSKDCGFVQGEPCMGVYSSVYTCLLDLLKWYERRPQIFDYISSQNQAELSELGTFARYLRQSGYYTSSAVSYAASLVHASRIYPYTGSSSFLAYIVAAVVAILLYICVRATFYVFRNLKT